jgi:Zn-dependent metalloprotease
MNMAALAAMFCILSACGGRHHPSKAEILAKVNESQEVQALKKKNGQELVIDKEIESDSLYTQTFIHQVNGIEVLGSGVRYHLNQKDVSLVSSHLKEIPSELSPKLSASEAIARAQAIEPTKSVVTVPVLKILPPMQTRPARMIYVIGLSTQEEIWINAENGEHVATLEEGQDALSADKNGIIFTKLPADRCSIGTLKSDKVSEFGKTQCLKKQEKACQVLNWESLPVAFHPHACKKASAADESSARADQNSKKFLDYFKKTHKRDSYDNLGSPIVSIVHAGQEYANASWFKKEKILVYGDGDGSTFKDFTFGVDIAGHELTHGVIQSSAGLIALGETGALNESLADYFGKLVEGAHDWNFGKNVFADSSGNQAIRDLLDPSRLLGQFKDKNGEFVTRPYPEKVSEAAPIIEPCLEKNDFCAIHYNATVPGHTWYLIHERLGQEKAEALLYLALTHYFHELTDFKEAAVGTLAACGSLYDEATCGEVREIFTQSGMI